MCELRFRQRQNARWRTVRMLNPIDEYTRECLAICCERSGSSTRVIAALADVMVMRGVPERLRSDNDPEFAARDLRRRLAATSAKTPYIEPVLRERPATARASTPRCGMSS